jgi:hypothetical protein
MARGFAPQCVPNFHPPVKTEFWSKETKRYLEHVKKLNLDPLSTV